jgi:hypothetical protein
MGERSNEWRSASNSPSRGTTSRHRQLVLRVHGPAKAALTLPAARADHPVSLTSVKEKARGV